MGQTTVRIKESTRAVLKALAREEGRSMQAILERAIEEYRRKCFLERVNAAYAELRGDSDAWAELEAELAGWDSALADGLPDGETWSDEGRAAEGKKRKERGK